MNAFCANGDGNKVARGGLCRRCYDAVPHEERTGDLTQALPVVRVTEEMAREIDAAAPAAGLTSAAWRRRAYRAQLRRLRK